jgi:hypothetical protein
MDRKTLTIALAVALIGSFFLAYFSFFGQSISGFDMISKGGGDWQKYILLLIPISGVLLLLGELNNGNYILSRGILTWLPLLTLIYLVLVSPLIKGAAIGDVFKALGKGYGIGLWITLAASLVLAFYNPKGK